MMNLTSQFLLRDDIALIGWLAYSVINRVGWPGTLLKDYRWQHVATLECDMSTLSEHLGWCQGAGTQEPGTYRLVITQPYWRFGGSEKVSHLGIRFNAWDGNADAQSELNELLPVKTSDTGLIVGMLIAKIGEGRPFQVKDHREFEIKAPAAISIGPNLPPGSKVTDQGGKVQVVNWLGTHTGKVIVKVQRKIED